MYFKDGSRDGGWGCAFVIPAFVIAIALAMTWSALAIGAANAWVLNAQFSDGWHAAWGKPWVLLGWSLLFMGTLAGTRRSSD